MTLPAEKSPSTRSAPLTLEQQYPWQIWIRVQGPDGVSLKFFPKRVLVALVVMAVLSWLTLAGATYLFLKQKHDFQEINYWNIALPTRWSEHRRALGEHYINRARKALQEGRPVDAFYAFSAGLARKPDDLLARRQFAIINLRVGRIDAAVAIIKEGFKYGRRDLEHLRQSFALLAEMQRDEDVLQVATLLLPPKPTREITDAFIALQAASANFRLGRYDEVDRLLKDWQLQRSVEGVLLFARCDWERGYTEAALNRLLSSRGNYPGRDEVPLQLIRFYRELGDHQRARQEALVRVSGDPLSPGPRVDLLHSLQVLGEKVQFNREVEIYIRDFGKDPTAVLLLSRLGADLGLPDLTKRASTQARLLKVTMAPFDVTEVESLVVADRFAEARQLADKLQPTYPASTPAGRLLAGWRAVAAYGAGDPTNGEVFLQAFIGDGSLRGSEALSMAAALERIGAQNAVRRILTVVVSRQPQNQPALTRLVRLDAIEANLPGLEENLPRLLKMSKPSRAVLQEAFSALNDATPARAALRRQVGEAVKRLTANPEPGA